jgi:hypothetical protein
MSSKTQPWLTEKQGDDHKQPSISGAEKRCRMAFYSSGIVPSKEAVDLDDDSLADPDGKQPDLGD